MDRRDLHRRNVRKELVQTQWASRLSQATSTTLHARYLLNSRLSRLSWLWKRSVISVLIVHNIRTTRVLTIASYHHFHLDTWSAGTFKILDKKGYWFFQSLCTLMKGETRKHSRHCALPQVNAGDCRCDSFADFPTSTGLARFLAQDPTDTCRNQYCIEIRNIKPRGADLTFRSDKTSYISMCCWLSTEGSEVMAH